jgi:[acyl-carrier-protein] S-malonyltransferase
MTPSVAFLFPGQNSRYPSMLDRLVAGSRENLRWVQRASDALGRDLARHYQAGNPAIFARNRDVQIGVFLANHLHWQTLERAGVRAERSAGLSLGEYNHLVHIGALAFEDAVTLLDGRGAAYENGPSGRMTAVFPAGFDEIQALLTDLGFGDRVGVAMINSPRQVVLAGDREAVDTAAARAEDAFSADSVVIDDAVPMHSPLFRSVADAFRPALESVRWRVPTCPYVSNVSGRIETNPTPHLFVDLLSRHVCSTVRWRECIDAILAEGRRTTLVEVGPKSVLSGLLSRKWCSAPRYATDAAADRPKGLAGLIEELSSGPSHAAGAC